MLRVKTNRERCGEPAFAGVEGYDNPGTGVWLNPLASRRRYHQVGTRGRWEGPWARMDD